MKTVVEFYVSAGKREYQVPSENKNRIYNAKKTKKIFKFKYRLCERSSDIFKRKREMSV